MVAMRQVCDLSVIVWLKEVDLSVIVWLKQVDLLVIVAS